MLSVLLHLIEILTADQTRNNVKSHFTTAKVLIYR